MASLERGEVSLDDAIAPLSGHPTEIALSARLEEARMKVEKIKVPSGVAPDSVSLLTWTILKTRSHDWISRTISA